MHRTRHRLLALLAVLGMLLLGCSDDDSSSDASSGGGSDEDLTVGFIYVGPKDDFGYNQAAYEGSQAIEESGVEVLQAENVPETAEATQAMQEMIDQGADLIFATSFGHMEFAYELAEANPDVTFVHQGGLEPDPPLDNFGTYFGTVYEPVYLAGIAAGNATETDTLGYVYAFPIPQTLANINAFTLGAQSVNPDAETITIQTGSWCDPGLQAEAVQSLLDQDVDVITQHQDCTKTIIEATEAAGAFSVGYHADASELAPEGWLTGSEWDWAPLYTQIVETVQAGEFAESDFNGDYRVGLQTGDNPFVQSVYGPAVDEETQAAIEEAKAAIEGGEGVFTGPITDQEGEVVVAEGESLTYEEAETMDFFVEGVTGTIEG